MWFTGALLVAAFCGLLLGIAGNGIILLFLVAPVFWLILLPYHARLAVLFSTTLFNSAFIVPYVAGRPFLWEAVSVLGWSGIVVTLALREQAPDSGFRFRRNATFFWGIALFCSVLLFTMYMRGVGIRALGGSQVGGRIYVQQLLTAIFPVLFALVAPGERLLVRLFLIQCVLSLSYTIADLVFAYGQGSLFQILNFVELPTDGLNFESQSLSGGIRRFQSMILVATGLLAYIWVKNPFSDYLGKKGIWLWPLTLGMIVLGMLSGHRVHVYATFITIATLAWAQRYFTVARTIFAAIASSIVYLMLFVFAKDLPLSAQRALTIVPGIEVSPVAAYDAWVTLEGRRLIRDAGWKEFEKYHWLGRGFSKQKLETDLYVDQTDMWVDFGVFYNGTVGTLVNLGIPGGIAVALFLYGGSRSAFRIISRVRRLRINDDFSRMACVVCGFWFAHGFSFVFLHGDSEFTMRLFAMPGALLMICDYWLYRREFPVGTASEAAREPARAVMPFALRQPAT